MAMRSKQNKKVNGRALMEEVKNLALLGAGVVAGSMGGQMLDKMLKVEGGGSGLNARSMVRPLVLTGIGAYAALKTDQRMVRLLAAGVGASGIISLFKPLAKDVPLSGTGNVHGPVWANESYQGSGLLERFDPDLPLLMPGSGSGEEGMADEDVQGYSSIEII